MFTVARLLFFVSFIALIVGLFNPSIVLPFLKKEKRMKRYVFLIYIPLCILFFMYLAYLNGGGNLGTFLAAILLFAIIINILILISGLIKPNRFWFGENPTRGKIALAYGLPLIILIIAIPISAYISVSQDSASTNDPSSTDSSVATSSTDSSTAPDTPISKSQYNKVEIGMTDSQLKMIIPNMDSNNITDDGTTSDWMFINDNGGSADIYVDDSFHKITKKEEQGVLSENSNTYTDKAGTHKNKDNEISNNNSSSDSNVNVDDTLNSKIRSAAKPQLGQVEKVEINDDMGKNDGGKIVLIHVKSNDVDKRLAQYQTSIVMRNEFKISKVNEVVVFWDADLVGQDGKQFVGEVAKIGITKDVAKNINWSSFDYTQYPKITNDYYMSHLLK